MKHTVIVFSIIMAQLFLSLAWHKIGTDPFYIWVCGCVIADVAALVVYIFLDRDF